MSNTRKLWTKSEEVELLNLFEALSQNELTKKFDREYPAIKRKFFRLKKSILQEGGNIQKISKNVKNFDQLLSIYGLEVLKFEKYLYQSAAHFSDDYEGGFWESFNVEGDNEFYLLLNDEKTYHLKSDNGEFAVDSKTFSLAVFAYSANAFGWYLWENDNTCKFAAKLFDLYHFTMRNAHKILKESELKIFHLFLD